MGRYGQLAVWGLLMLLVIAGCGREQQETGAMTNYIMVNGLEMISNEPIECVSAAGNQVRLTSAAIRGLRDTVLERQINQRLEEAAWRLVDAPLPMYRGLKAVIPEAWEMPWQCIETQILGNFNDVMSVNISRVVTYDYLPTVRHSVRIKQSETYNMDLHTGRELVLADLFPEEAEYEAVLNEAVRKALWERAEEASDDEARGLEPIVLPFAGISADQRFALSSDGLILYLGDIAAQGPEVFEEAAVTIDWQTLSQVGPFAQRFYDAQGRIYTGETPAEPILLEREQPVAQLVDFGQWESLTAGFDGLICGDYPSDAPAGVIEQVKQWAVPDADWLQLMEGELAQRYFGEYGLTVTAKACGDYYTISRLQWIQAFLKIEGSLYSDAASGKRYQVAECRVYDRQHGQLVDLATLFIPGYDYQAVIRQAISAQGLTAGEDSAAAITSWGLQNDGLIIIVPVERYQTAAVTIAFSTFGREKMTIFH